MSSTASIPIIRPDDYSSVAHPGDLLSRRQRLVYVLILGALTALGPFTVDLYLPAFPVLQDELGVSAAAVQLTLTGTMVGFGFGQLIVGPWSDKVGRRLPLILATALHIAASVAAALSPDIVWLSVFRLLQGFGAAAGGVVAMAMVRDLFGGKPLVRMLSRLALVNGLAPVLAPVIGSQLLGVMDWRGVFVVLGDLRRGRARGRRVLHRRDAARVPSPRGRALDAPRPLRRALPRPGVPRRRDHRRHDLHRPLRVPLDVVVPVPGGLRLHRAAVRPALRRELGRHHHRRADELAAHARAGAAAVDPRGHDRGAPRHGDRHHRARLARAPASGAPRSRSGSTSWRAGSRSRPCRCSPSRTTARRPAPPRRCSAR